MSFSYDDTDLGTDTASGRLGKKCTDCGEVKPPEFFHRDSAKEDGRRKNCKVCKNKKDNLYREKNKHAIKVRQANYYQCNKHLFYQHNAYRRSKKIEATPDWLSGPQKAHIKRTYYLANFMQEITGRVYHVDHIVPLNNENVCGLHVPWNLSVVPAEVNLKKSNSFEGW